MRSVPIGKVYSILKKDVARFKVPIVDLVKAQTDDPFKILVATMLSARTKDETTAKAAERLFRRVKKPADLDRLSAREIEQLIFPAGFYRNKALFLKKLPEALKRHFNGKIPNNVEELVRLPGVGRKTANLVVALAFDRPAVCVDTHVHRIMNRLGYVSTKTPLDTEMALRKKLPQKYWITFNSVFVAYGQSVCRPISPKCGECRVYRYCNRVGVEKIRK